LSGARDRVALADRSANHLLQAALAQLAAPGHVGVRTFPVRRQDRDEHDRESRSDPALRTRSFSALRRSLSRSLIEGEPLGKIAARSGVTPNTATTHLKRVFAKTVDASAKRSLSACSAAFAQSRHSGGPWKIDRHLEPEEQV
jgi:hypothetical protein